MYDKKGNLTPLGKKVMEYGKKNEKLGKDADAGDYIDDFRKSDAPQFKGKSDEKIRQMAVAAYLKAKEKNETVDEKIATNKERMNMAALDALKKLIASKGDKQSLKSYAYTIAKSFSGMSGKDLETLYRNSIKEQVDEEIEGLKKKAEKSGISYGILKKVYDRGMAAWKTGHRPGTTPQQWAFARVNSFITGGGARKSDADLWAER